MALWVELPWGLPWDGYVCDLVIDAGDHQPFMVTDMEPVCVVGDHGCVRVSSSTPYLRGTDKVSHDLYCCRTVV